MSVTNFVSRKASFFNTGSLDSVDRIMVEIQNLIYLLHNLTQIRNRESAFDRFCSISAANLLSDYVGSIGKI